jgi:hypothetical protein
MAASQFYFQSGKQKCRVGEGRHSCSFWLQILLWKGKRKTVRCRAATASSSVAKVRGEVFAHFQAVAVKRHSSICPARANFFCENPLNLKENNEHVLDFVLHLPRLLSVCPEPSMPFKHPCTAHACLIIARVSAALFTEISTKFEAVPFSDPSRNRIRPDTRLHMQDRKESARPTSCIKFCTRTPKIC